MHPQSPKLSSRGATIPSFSLGYPRPAVRLTCSGLQIPGLAAPSRVLTEATTGGQDRELLRSELRSSLGASHSTAALRASGLSLPPSLPPTPPAHPAGLLVFCPVWPTFPQLSLGESQPGTASRVTRRPRLGRRGPTPARSCHWSQGGGWVGWGGGC